MRATRVFSIKSILIKYAAECGGARVCVHVHLMVVETLTHLFTAEKVREFARSCLHSCFGPRFQVAALAAA